MSTPTAYVPHGLLLLALLAIAAVFSVQRSAALFQSADAEVTPGGEVVFSRTFDVAPGGRLEADLGALPLVVRTGTGSEASVAVYGQTAEAFTALHFTAEQVGQTLRVRTAPGRQRTGFGTSEAAYTVVVTVPERFDATLAAGRVDLDRLDGDLTIRTTTGDVHVGAATGGSVRLTSADGDVEAGTLRAAYVGLRSGTGDVRAQRVESPALETAAPWGEVTVERLVRIPALASRL